MEVMEQTGHLGQRAIKESLEFKAHRGQLEQTGHLGQRVIKESLGFKAHRGQLEQTGHLGQRVIKESLGFKAHRGQLEQTGQPAQRVIKETQEFRVLKDYLVPLVLMGLVLCLSLHQIMVMGLLALFFHLATIQLKPLLRPT
jgi:hypothetical protein